MPNDDTITSELTDERAGEAVGLSAYDRRRASAPYRYAVIHNKIL